MSEDNVQGGASEGVAQGGDTNAQVAGNVPLTSESLAKALADFRGEISRDMQSFKDKTVNEVSRARPAVHTPTSVDILENMDTEGLDPQLQNEILKARIKAQQLAQQRASQVNQQTQFEQQFLGNLKGLATGLNIKDDDSRLDWGDASVDYLTRMNRFQSSVTKIQNEDVDKRVQERLAESNRDARVKKGLESHDTAGGSGIAPVAGDAEFLGAFGAGTIPYTKENKERAEKLLANDDKLIS